VFSLDVQLSNVAISERLISLHLWLTIFLEYSAIPVNTFQYFLILATSTAQDPASSVTALHLRNHKELVAPFGHLDPVHAALILRCDLSKEVSYRDDHL
jgi:hypothetical protein